MPRTRTAPAFSLLLSTFAIFAMAFPSPALAIALCVGPSTCLSIVDQGLCDQILDCQWYDTNTFTTPDIVLISIGTLSLVVSLAVLSAAIGLLILVQRMSRRQRETIAMESGPKV